MTVFDFLKKKDKIKKCSHRYTIVRKWQIVYIGGHKVAVRERECYVCGKIFICNEILD